MRRAFVIQFDRAIPDKHCRGRIEHVPTGRRRHFDSFAEVESFARQILNQVEADEADVDIPSDVIRKEE